MAAKDRPFLTDVKTPEGLASRAQADDLVGMLEELGN